MAMNVGIYGKLPGTAKNIKQNHPPNHPRSLEKRECSAEFLMVEVLNVLIHMHRPSIGRATPVAKTLDHLTQDPT